MTDRDHERDADAIRASVAGGYGAIARGEALAASAEAEAPAASSGCCGPAASATSPAAGTEAAGGGCCGPTMAVDELAQALGYDPAELAALPGGANLGLSCGNPAAIAALSEGETVLDLGSGAGFDVFLAGPKVGAAGRAIGVDMTPDMLARARRNVASYRERTGLDNVEFRLGEIEHLPVADASVDAVISNCVLNLAPDKRQVWAEVARVLRPGGRAAISDLGLCEPLPPGTVDHLEALIGCVAGAELVDDTCAHVAAVGLELVRLERHPAYVDSLVGANDPLYHRLQASLPPGRRIAEYVTSFVAEVRRPRGGC
ncbi:arsenite methyltransferase [Engelhardtia mirabilis]|uniref:Arsenite methyltransferase n=1 Tax=Engelhardtia mirabilis TaxID=2528011 RepID=A0A518BHH9_9BACT|nr:putative methyltransferase YcgJ [Planctomycetes bacterium Pla133]QDV00764.1 putative methyltransferase YcgJ [Planctomycetes bacterium Pla86]